MITKKENLPVLPEGMEVAVCDRKPDFQDKTRFVRLDDNSGAKMQISAFAQQLPAIAGIASYGNMYTVTFPDGLPHTLSQFKDGSGFFGDIRNPENGRFMGKAVLNPVDSGYIALASAMTVMSIVTSQYYLSEINNKLNYIQKGVDNILDFLHVDKRAELLSEYTFIKYAQDNFTSIMNHPHQRQATLCAIQDAKKVAMKDLEFYLDQLEKLVNNEKDIVKLVNSMLNWKSCLDISKQLFAMSSIMEMFYAQNMDKSYVSYIEKELRLYLNRTDKHILQSFAKRVNDVLESKNKSIDSEIKNSFRSIMEELNGGEDGYLQKAVTEIIHAPEKKAVYYLNDDGEMYMRKEA